MKLLLIVIRNMKKYRLSPFFISSSSSPSPSLILSQAHSFYTYNHFHHQQQHQQQFQQQQQQQSYRLSSTFNKQLWGVRCLNFSSSSSSSSSLIDYSRENRTKEDSSNMIERSSTSPNISCTSRTPGLLTKCSSTMKNDIIISHSTRKFSSKSTNTDSSDITGTDDVNITSSISSKRGRRAVSLLPSYLADARSVQQYHKDSCPDGALQIGVAETKLMQDDWLVPALNNIDQYFSDSNTNRSLNNDNDRLYQLSSQSLLGADAIYYQPTSGRADVKQTLARYIVDTLELESTNNFNDDGVSLDNNLALDGLIIGAGCNAVLENLCFTLTDPGDAVLIPTPYYAAFEFDLGARAALSVVPVTTMKYHKHQQFEESTSTASKHNSSIIDPTVYYPTVEALNAAYDRAVQAGTPPKVLLLSHPMNPLGIYYPSETIAECIGWCRSRCIHLISDEIYAGSVYGNCTNNEESISSLSNTVTTSHSAGTSSVRAPFVSALKVAANMSKTSRDSIHTVGLGLGPYVHWVYAMSKDFGLSGLRVGVAYTENPEIILPLQKLNDLCQVSSQTQLLTKRLLETVYVRTNNEAPSTTAPSKPIERKYNSLHSPPNPQQDDDNDTGETKSISSSLLWYQAFRNENHNRLQERATRLTQVLDEYNVPYIEPTAGLFVWIDLSKFMESKPSNNSNDHDPERSLYIELIYNYGLLLTPGASMKSEYPGYFRFVFTAPSDNNEFDLAINRLRSFLQDKTATN